MGLTVPGGGAGVACEQLIWSWNQVTLAETGAGYGPIERSAHWPFQDPADPAGGLGGRTRFLPGGFEDLLEQHEAPVALYVSDIPAGRLAVRKSFLGKDAFGRNSRWLVQAALDPSRQLHPADVLAADAAGLFAAEVDRAGIPVRTDLPPLVLPPAPPPPARLERTEILLSRLLPALMLIRTQPQFAPLAIRAHRAGDVAALITSVISVLPREFSASLTFTTFDAEPGSADVDVAGAIEPFSEDVRQDPDRLWLDLIENATNFPEPGPVEAAITAELLDVCRADQRPPDDLATLDELQGWVRSRALLRQAPETLRGAEMAELLVHPVAVQWLSSPDAWAAMTRGLDQDPEWGPTIAQRLRPVLTASAPAQCDAWSADLVRRLGAALLSGPVSGRPATWRIVADELALMLPGGAPELAQRLASETTTMVRQGFSAGEGGVDPWLTDVIASHSGTMDDADRLRWLSQPGVAERVPAEWSPLARELAVATLRGRPEWPHEFTVLALRQPASVAQVIDDLMRQHIIADGDLLRMVLALPIESLPAVFDVLMAAHQVEPGFLLFDVLADPRLEPERARRALLGPLLQRHWSALGRAAKLPPAVVATLDVRPDLGDAGPAPERHDGDLTVAGQWGDAGAGAETRSPAAVPNAESVNKPAEKPKRWWPGAR